MKLTPLEPLLPQWAAEKGREAVEEEGRPLPKDFKPYTVPESWVPPTMGEQFRYVRGGGLEGGGGKVGSEVGRALPRFLPQYRSPVHPAGSQ